MKFDISYEGKKYPKIILKREVGWWKALYKLGEIHSGASVWKDSVSLR